jgi:phage/plasmid-like protein (TIGR03299 family)
MAHNIEFNTQKKSYSFFSRKEKAWHGLGKVVKDYLTSAEAIEAANLDFKVATARNNLIFREIDKPDRIIENPTSVGIYRTDNFKVLGTAGNRYTPIQNKEAFDFVDSIVGEGEAVFDTAGALGNGEEVFISLKLPEYININNDKIEKYLLIVLNHAGTGSMYIMFTPIRVVCNNTLRMALSGCKTKVSIRHTTNYKQKISQAKKTLGLSNKVFTLVEEALNELTEIKYDMPTTRKLIQLQFMTTEEIKELAKDSMRPDSEILSTRKLNIIQDFWDYTVNGPGQDHKNCVGTAYGLFNGLTGYYGNVKKTNSKERRFKNVFDNTDFETFYKMVKDPDKVRKEYAEILAS